MSSATHDDRLQQADLLDRVDEFGERIGVEDLSRLAWIRDDVARRDLDVDRADDGVEVRWRTLGRYR
jgi:hypothetical protein